jgi:hypothetical protein
MKPTQHAPAIWRTEETQTSIWIGTPKGASKIDEVVCQMDILGLTDAAKEYRRANAAFIVRAVNSHAELIAALKNIEDEMRGLSAHLTDHFLGTPKLTLKSLAAGSLSSADKARAAILKATGGQS